MSGLKNLGVREMTYRLAFVASSVQPQQQRASGCSIRDQESGGGIDAPDAVNGPEKMTDEERSEIEAMRATPQLYHKLVKSVAPAHNAIVRDTLKDFMTIGSYYRFLPTDPYLELFGLKITF